MRRIIAIVLCIILCLTGCSSKQIVDNTYNDNTTNDNLDVNISEVSDIAFSGMNDELFLGYVKDNVYSETIRDLDSDKYVVEEVRTSYLSKEYIDEVAYNSQSNIYFGYTLEELNDFLQDKRYIFTLGDDGNTTIEELQEVSDNNGEQILKNVAIGSGVILVCVTVSIVSAGVGAPEAITAIFAASAKTAEAFAISSGMFGAISAGIVRGYQTGNITEALKAASLAGSEGFKWGAITGSVDGGGKEAFLLKAGTKGGLSMSNVATIQRESKYPIEVISRFNTMEQYEICKSSGLTVKMINGRTALVRQIDLNYVDEVTGKTNIQLMEDGYAPIAPDGNKYELHHIGQKKDSPLAILTREEHRGKGNDSIWHILKDGFDNPSSQPEWADIKKQFWKDYAKKITSGEIFK